MGKLPAFQFYPGDWLQDSIAGCSLASQGLFFRLCMLADENGELRFCGGGILSPLHIQRFVGHFGLDLTEPLEELIRIGVLGKKREGLFYIPKLHKGKLRFFSNPKRSSLSPKLRAWIKDKFKFRCASCGSSERLEIDHIKPVSLGGDDSASNLQLLCFSCNRKKGPRRGRIAHA